MRISEKKRVKERREIEKSTHEVLYQIGESGSTNPRFHQLDLSFFIAFGNLADDTINFEAFPHKLVQFGEIQEKLY
uniref:Putative defective coat protein n=1 Tax=Bean pod mottle virus TaxID=12260 RepID=Q99A74_9SECO|nr:putative defective coat protein [Bean pod mottle virus]